MGHRRMGGLVHVGLRRTAVDALVLVDRAVGHRQQHRLGTIHLFQPRHVSQRRFRLARVQETAVAPILIARAISNSRRRNRSIGRGQPYANDQQYSVCFGASPTPRNLSGIRLRLGRRDLCGDHRSAIVPSGARRRVGDTTVSSKSLTAYFGLQLLGGLGAVAIALVMIQRT